MRQSNQDLLSSLLNNKIEQPKTDTIDLETIKLLQQILLEDYKTHVDEIKSLLDSSRQLVSMSLVATGLLITISSYIVQIRMPTFFLVAPIFLYGVAWVQMRYVILAILRSNNLKRFVIPNIRRNLANLAHKTNIDIDTVMNWEFERSKVRYNPARFFVISSDYGIPIVAAALFVCAYLIFVNEHR